MKKGEILKSGNDKNVYRVTGFWGKDVVLENTGEGLDEVLIYTAIELETLILEGKFKRQDG